MIRASRFTLASRAALAALFGAILASATACASLGTVAGFAANVLVALDSMQTAGSTGYLPGRSGTGSGHVDTVNAGATDAYTITYQSGEPITLRIRGNHATDLDCYLYASDGRLLASDEDDTDDCVLNTRLAGPAQVRVRIVNLGRASNRYELNKR